MMDDRAAYLRRIGYDGPLTPTADTLAALHEAHLLAVPFENLDIHLGRPIVLDEALFHDKIVLRRRGGFCYELNGLFAALLRDLGFAVTPLAARVARKGSLFGPEFDHLALRVDVDGSWLVDVGFGDGFRRPLLLANSVEQARDGYTYRFDRAGAAWTLLRRADDEGEWRAQYRFTLAPRRLADFAGMCRYHQTSPESGFTRHKTVVRLTPDGLVTLRDATLTVAERGERRESALSGEDAYDAALRAHFGIALDD